MLNFEKEVIEFTLHGEVSKIYKPTNGEIKKYVAGLAECKNDDAKEQALKDFLFALGLDNKVYDLLTPNQLKTLLKEIHGTEKN